MRRTLLALIASGLIGAALMGAAGVDARARTASAAPAPVTATTFLLSGRGWGHGVGMSQYGALGFANEGRTHEQILSHFYAGATLGPAPVAQVRVLLAEARPALTVSSKAPFRIRDVFGRIHAHPAGSLELGPKLEVVVNGVPTPFNAPLVLIPGRSPLELGGLAYRGRLEVALSAKKLTAINLVGLEDYLAGVVPREMPAAWPAEALKAQAVAARSYALAHRLVGKPFDLYADVRSQVYGGIAAEDLRATAAIKATAGRVLLYDGKPVDALFHSTSGGRTVSAAEAFGTSVPYLVAADDPHSALSPVDRWGPTAVPEAAIRKGLALPGPVLGVQLARAESGRVRTATVRTATGSKVVPAGAFRSALGLRSTWVTALATLSLTRPGVPVTYGRGVTIRTAASGVKNVVLAQQVDGSWTQVATRPAGGAFTFTAKLLGPSSFRLSTGTVAGPVLQVPVAPLVTATRQEGGIGGTVLPARAGTKIQVQVLEGDEWLPAAEAIADDVGSFFAELETVAGTYRVRVAPARGFAEGLSPRLRLG